MKKLFSLPLILLFFASCNSSDKESLGNNYLKDNQGIYFYEHQGDVFLEEADPDTFEVLEHYFAKDQDTVFYQKHTVNVEDVATFEPLNKNFAKDKFNVYERHLAPIDVPNNIIFQKNSEIDLETFEILDISYAKDKNRVYAYDVMYSSNAKYFDAQSFEILESGCYTKDSNHIYKYGDLEIIEQADLESFEALNLGEHHCFAKDINHVYERGKIVEKFDPESFKILNGETDSCKYYVYLDKKAVYFFDQKIENADPKSFQLTKGEYFAKDKNASYYLEGQPHSPLGPCDYSVQKADL